jgi:hypothetical protein
MKETPLTTTCTPQAGVVPTNTSGNTLFFTHSRKEKTMKYRLRLPAGETLRKIRFLTFTLVLSVIVLGLAPLAVAQQPIDPPTLAELEDFRRDLGQVLQELDQHRTSLRQNKLVRDALDHAKLPAAPPLAKVQLQLQQMTYEELAQVYKGFATAFPDWRETPQALGRIAGKIGRQPSEGIGGQPSGGKGDRITQNAITPDNCQDAFDAAPSITDWSAAKAAAIAADGLQNVIPPPLNFVATGVYIAAEEGALVAETLNGIFDRCQGDQDIADIQTAISNVQTSANMIVTNANANTTSILNSLTTAKTDIVNNDNSNRTAITVAIAGAQTAINDNTTSTANANTTTITNVITASKNEIVTNDNSNKTMIVTNDNANATTINNNLTAAKNTIVANDNTNTTTIVNNDNANKTAIINNDNANKAMIVANDNANKDLLLRAHIEADLAQAENATPVAWFLTPTAQGGHLNLVQAIVTQTLANIVAAGGSIGTAQSSLDQANADMSAGRFKDAYKNYRKAYKTAAN